MKKVSFRSLLLLVLLLSASLVRGQKASVVINQTNNAVVFTEDGQLWGLKINGKQELPPNFKSITYKDGLYILCDMNGEWNVADDKVKVVLEDWFQCAGVKVSEKVVIFLKVDGKEDLIYDRATWTLTTAKETTYDDMYEDAKAKYAGQGTSISNYETAAEQSRRIYRTKPRYVAPKSSGDKASIVRDDNVIASWTGNGKWVKPHVSYFGGPGSNFPHLGESPYTEVPTELYFLVHDTEENRDYVIWVKADGSDKYFIEINGKKNGYVKITPHPTLPTRLMMCQTADGIEHLF